MPDPRNVAHDKKVQEEKKEQGEDIGQGGAVTPQPGKKPPAAEDPSDAAVAKKGGDRE